MDSNVSYSLKAERLFLKIVSVVVEKDRGHNNLLRMATVLGGR